MKHFMCILFSSLALFSCRSKTAEAPPNIYIATVVDITDPRQIYPVAETILPLFNFTTDENSAATFKMCLVTDRELNPDIEFHLPGGAETEKDNTEDDPDYRKKRIVQFFSSIRNAIGEFNTKVKSEITFAHSECFKSISNELQNIVYHKSNKGILLVYSDLQENSTIFNCYSASNKEILTSHAENIAEIFEKTLLLPKDLNNITVCFIYNPVSRDDDTRFMAMFGVYKKLLQSRGAIVSVSASNPTNIQL